jgi:hypothetical protein
MKRLIMTAAVASAVALAVPISASAGNPIFGSAKVQILDTKQMKTVVGQNTTSAYYAYLGQYYGGLAAQYASYGVYLEGFGAGYQGTRNSQYYNAYNYAAMSSLNYYYAYYYN